MPPRKPQDPPPKSNERNEYIPSFIAKKPFYIDDATASDSDYLEHQRLQNEKNSDTLANQKWYERGASRTTGPAATKFRKGACDNCGAMTHKAKDCLQRKRKLGAKWTGKNIAADERVQDVQLGWDAKRDRWNGYEAEEFREVVDEYDALESMKRAAEAEGEGIKADGDRYEEETDMGRQQATSTRNLRLREDTAKYLVDLDLESAQYNPKTRAMVDQPPGDDVNEGFERANGDAAEFERAQKYAWETQERGDKDRLHLQANPTAGEIGRKRKREEEEEKLAARKKMLADRYGDQSEVRKNPLEDVAVTSNETYVEYDERGRIKGQPQKIEKSMYAEDVLVNNHTSVWGSWWTDFKWGYACCHSIVKNSYCTGEAGLKATEESEAFRRGEKLPTAAESGNAEPEAKQIAWKEEERQEEFVPNGTEDDGKAKVNESKRKVEATKDSVVEEEMERYMREKAARDDPMKRMGNGEELLEI
ncbi:hypothetical protein MBLNU230_g6753t1 [Neophaeotheca triangularis]